MGPERNHKITTTMEGAAVDPEFMQKMKTLKWSKDEQFIKTPEYETRKRALFEQSFRGSGLSGRSQAAEEEDFDGVR